MQDSPTPGDGDRGGRQLAQYAAASGMVIGPVWVAATLISGLMRRHYSFAAQPISDLGIGSHAWIVNASLIVTGALALVFTLGFARLVPPWPKRTAACALLATFGIGFAAAGIFHEPKPDGPLAVGGVLHFVLGFFVAMTSLVVALFLISSGLRTRPGWSGQATHARTAGLLVIVLMVLTQLFFNPSSPLYELGIGGLLEWALFMTWSSWFMVTAYALFRRDKRANGTSVDPPEREDRAPNGSIRRSA